MRQQVAGHAGTRRRRVQAPEARAALRQIGRDGPVLQEVGAVMEDAAETAFVDELLGHGDRRDAAVVVPDGVEHLGAFDGRDHLLAFGGVKGERLLAHDHLAGLGRRDGDLHVAVVGRADVDDVDILALDELAPIGLDGFVAPRVGEGAGVGLAAAADGLEDGLMFVLEEVARPCGTHCYGCGP